MVSHFSRLGGATLRLVHTAAHDARHDDIYYVWLTELLTEGASFLPSLDCMLLWYCAPLWVVGIGIHSLEIVRAAHASGQTLRATSVRFGWW